MIDIIFRSPARLVEGLPGCVQEEIIKEFLMVETYHTIILYSTYPGMHNLSYSTGYGT